MNRQKTLGFCLLACFLSPVCVISAETTCELRDGRYWINVPSGRTYTNTAEDVEALVPLSGTQPELWKVGGGTLCMTTNILNGALMKGYNADIHVTNGMLRVLSEYGLGNYTTGVPGADSQTFVWSGAALDSAYQRIEAVDGTQKGITQREMIHIAGNGFGNYSALNESVGNHIMLGRVTLDADARMGSYHGTVQLRYHTLNFNGHQLRSGGKLSFSTMALENVPHVPLVMSSGHQLVFNGTGLDSNERNHFIRFENDSAFLMEGLSRANCYWGLSFVSNGTVGVTANASRSCSATNTWNGPISVGSGGTLGISFGKPSQPMTLNGSLTGGCVVRVNADGTLQLGAAPHRIRRLELDGAGRKIRLPADFVLEVRSLLVNGEEKPAGDYASANCANILAGTVRVNPQADVLGVEQTGLDYAVTALGDSSVPQLAFDMSGNCSIAVAGTARATISFQRLQDVLNRSRLHVDACTASSINYASWLSEDGRKGVYQWWQAGGGSSSLYFENFRLTPESNGQRYVSAYPTLLDHTVNGVTRPYMDMGMIDGDKDTSEGYYNNSHASSSTTAAMRARPEGVGGALSGCEYHLVFGDAHPNPNNANRMALLGRNNSETAPAKQPGRRGANGMLFARHDDQTVPFRDGRIWVDNMATNYTYVPAMDDVHVYTLIPTNAFAGPAPSDFERFNVIGVDSYARYGGARYGELLVYSGGTNTAAERAWIDAYLMKKWTGRGLGPELLFGTVTLKDGATLTFACPDCADFGCCYSIANLEGDGSIAVGARDSLKVENLTVAFRDRETCGTISSSAPLALAPVGTVTLRMPVGRRAKKGVYKIFEATQATNVEALDSWNLACDDKSFGLVRRGNALYVEAEQTGTVILIR